METMKKRKYNKRTPRQYMEAIREMVNARGVFYLRDVSARHFGTRQARMGEAMRSLGWTTREGGGLAWVGKRPKTEAELLAMATILSENVRSRDIASYRAYNKKDKKVLAKKPKSDPKVPECIVPEPKAKRVTKRKKYSILWGLFTWEK